MLQTQGSVFVPKPIFIQNNKPHLVLGKFPTPFEVWWYYSCPFVSRDTALAHYQGKTR